MFSKNLALKKTKDKIKSKNKTYLGKVCAGDLWGDNVSCHFYFCYIYFLFKMINQTYNENQIGFRVNIDY